MASAQTPASSTDILKGMSQIINTQNVQEGIDYEEIEKMYLGSVKKEEKQIDPTEAFRAELKNLANRLELSFDTPVSTNTPRAPTLAPSPMRDRGGGKSPRTPSAGGRTPSSSMRTPMSSVKTQLNLSSPFKSSMAASPRMDHLRTPSKNNLYNPPDDYEDDGADDDDKAEDDVDDGNDGGSVSTSSHDFGLPSTPQRVSRFGSRENKTELERRTDEQIRHEQIHDVMNDMGAQNTTIFTLEQTRRQDEKLTMLDEIASLKMSLEEDEAKGIENIPRVDSKSSYDEVENVLKSYRLINDRMRYCSLADEFILWGAQGMEELFNGQRTWFGRYNPDLTGWSKQVSVKLRRMRHETSQLVGGVMHDYNIGPGMRIILELIPNMFMYARTKKQNYGKPTLMSDTEISRAISDIRDYN